MHWISFINIRPIPTIPLATSMALLYNFPELQCSLYLLNPNSAGNFQTSYLQRSFHLSYSPHNFFSSPAAIQSLFFSALKCTLFHSQPFWHDTAVAHDLFDGHRNWAHYSVCHHVWIWRIKYTNPTYFLCNFTFNLRKKFIYLFKNQFRSPWSL